MSIGIGSGSLPATQGLYSRQTEVESRILADALQRFIQRVSYICNLKGEGKIDTQRAYEAIKLMWDQLQQTHQDLGIAL